ncbi:hypothetical protein EZ449_22450 [Pedobacter frigidisoli]|uniref:HEAT repeat-containing protein n=1 Tax=Pedobacter frigidisoli TaxID=2530455 RepID=A0A4R0NA27_9SPHI|nr:hypothetical protein [Pedobacter frigidisoli]TCC96163.1 hypothetical protein EZ449_22450 [Pedobacter frigidisoli]
MNEFVNKFKAQIDSFWDVGEYEKKMVLSEVLKYANSNQQKFKNEINQVKFDNDLMALPIISEALSMDTENWGQFYVDLLDDILETAKQSSKPNDILNNLQEFSYIENDSKPFVQKIVDRLYKEVDAENLNVKLASIWTLPNYLDNNSLRNKSSIIDKLRQQLYNQNWKVRVVAFKSLGFENLLPDGYKLSLKDKLTKLFFGEPPII